MDFNEIVTMLYFLVAAVASAFVMRSGIVFERDNKVGQKLAKTGLIIALCDVACFCSFLFVSEFI